MRHRSGHRFLWLLVGCLSLTSAGSRADDGPRVMIVLDPPQERLNGPTDPTALEPSMPMSMLGYSLSQAVPLADVAGFATESLMLLAEYDREEIRRAASAQGEEPLDFRGLVVSGVESLTSIDAWESAELEQYAFGSNRMGVARGVLRDGEFDHVLFLAIDYRLDEGLDQLRIIVDSSVYILDQRTQRGDAIYHRRYEYASPSRGDLFRPFHEGEKEAMIAAVEAEYAEKLEEFPHNRRAYEKDRSSMVALLEKRDVILPVMALSEGWPNGSLREAIEDGTDRIMSFIREDIEAFAEAPDMSTKPIRFVAYSREGKHKAIKGWRVGERDGRLVYCDKEGNLYLLPAEHTET